MKPPAARAAADHRVQDPGESAAKQNEQRLHFNPVAEPRSPRLHRHAVEPHHPVINRFEWKIEQILAI